MCIVSHLAVPLNTELIELDSGINFPRNLIEIPQFTKNSSYQSSKAFDTLTGTNIFIGNILKCKIKYYISF